VVDAVLKEAPIVPRMSVIDEADGNNAVEDYHNGKTFPNTYNRVIVELTDGRGISTRYCLTAVDAPKDPDPEDYAEGKTLDSIPMRMNNGYIMSPMILATDKKALEKIAERGYDLGYYLMPKSYIDSYVDRLFTMSESGGIQSGAECTNTGNRGLSMGLRNKVTESQAFAFGEDLEANAWASFAANKSNKASAFFSSVFGQGNEATRKGQLVAGTFAPISSNYMYSVGVGTSDTARKLGFGVLWDGRVELGKDPTDKMQAVPKHLLDELGESVLKGLDSIITAQNELLGG
jgi:hypothetical protein